MKPHEYVLRKHNGYAHTKMRNFLAAYPKASGYTGEECGAQVPAMYDSLILRVSGLRQVFHATYPEAVNDSDTHPAPISTEGDAK